VTFSVKAGESGRATYRVSLPVGADEVSGLNNAATTDVSVRRRSVQVLYVAQKPGVTLKAVRNELARDPGIELTALFRTLGDRYTVQGRRRQGDDVLEEGFPDTAAALRGYDCLVIAGTGTETWTPSQAAALAQFVQEGGGVVLLGGAGPVSEEGALPETRAMLPWNYEDAPATQRGPFLVHVPSVAHDHAVMRGLSPLLDKAELESVWPLEPLKPGATALLVAGIGEHTAPVVALHRYGQGRVMAVGSRSLWRWSRESGGSRDAHGRFWRQAVRHLAGEEEGGRHFSVRWDQPQYRPGETARGYIRVRGHGRGVRFDASVVADGERRALAVDPAPGTEGFRVELEFRQRGAHEFELQATQNGELLDTYVRTFNAAPVRSEGSRLALNDRFLESMASRTGGRYVHETESDALLDELERSLAPPTVRAEVSLVREGPWFVILLLAVLVCEWYLRRRWDLV
jgi:uncharacterized membrane protein